MALLQHDDAGDEEEEEPTCNLTAGEKLVRSLIVGRCVHVSFVFNKRVSSHFVFVCYDAILKFSFHCVSVFLCQNKTMREGVDGWE